MLLNKLVVIDLETTGNSPKKGEKIIQLSAVIIENGKIVDQYTSFVNPEKSIPVFIEELTGINDELVEGAPLFAEIAPKILEILDEAVFVAHNVNFDLSFLQGELENAGYNTFSGPSFDTVELAKIALPTADSFKLSELSTQLDVSHVRPHQADSDAYVTAEILLHMVNELSELPLVTLEKLLELSSFLKSDLELLFREILKEKQAHVEDLPLDLEVYRGIALKKKAPIDRVDSDWEMQHIDKDNIEGLLKENIPFYENRTEQMKMMKAVSESLHESSHLLVEAGTGVGKSLAYLLPAVLFSKTNKKPVVISTFTIQLQEQLLHKEVNTLKKMLGIPLYTVLLKGKNHYIHLFKFEQSLRDHDPQYDIVLTKMQILVWLTRTITGDINELNLTSGGRLFLTRLRHDGWHLPHQKDPWVGKDFYLHARKNASDADLIITNHSLLLADVASENSMLPSYEYLIIDEAHHLEKSARQHLGIVLDYLSIKFTISQLGMLEQKQLFYKLEEILQVHQITDTSRSFELDFQLQNFYQEMDEAMQLLASVFYKKAKKRKGIQKIQLRLSETILKSKEWQPVKIIMERIVSDMNIIDRQMYEKLDKLKEKTNKLKDVEKAIVEEAYSFLLEWVELKTNIKNIFLQELEDYVIWLDGDIRSLPNSLVVQAQPIAVQSEMQTEIFQKKKSVILTSATLTVNGTFNYFMQEIGLNKKEVKQLMLSSPFHYKEISKLFVPTEIPDIGQVSTDEYVEAVSSHLIGVAEVTKGRMLILFTSYDMLRKTYDLMKDSGLLEDYVLMAQGITSGSRTRLTKNFQRFDKAILFGTSSFWEGVDIPGEDLSCLAMVRLPFSPPDEPVAEAKSEWLKEQGKNPFSANALPEAVIRFKQGVGRLIRRSSDRGIVIVYDRRIVTTRYGKAFLQSIPNIPVHQEELPELLGRIEEWL
ncbi:ATP-dependent DNA helicase DinG [Bacillus seohaeanensis]|uniref:3'-5' exonuclease DinG n=1 Tax=Bacillus seohaeanensis TaxID=284580 RepID=A0ABW5RSQ9_9BACI